MKKRMAILGVMWGAALVAAILIWLGQPQQGDGQPARRVTEHSPVRVAGQDRAPREIRADLPTRPPPEGPPQTFRGDRRHTGRSAYRGPPSAELAWAFETQGRISAQAVVADDGTIYIGSHDHHIYALSPHGLLKWKRDLHDRVYSTAALDPDGNVYVGSDADTFWALSPSGDVLWRLATEGDADGGAVFAPDGTLHFTAGNSLYALERDGTVKWRFEARSKIYSTPAVDEDGTVYVGSQDDHVYAVAADGMMRWSHRTGDDNDSSPVIGDDGTIFFGSDDHHVYALSRDGDLRWAANVDGYVRAPLALGSDGSVLVGVFGPRPRVVSLDDATGDVRWYFPVTVADSSELGISSGPLVDSLGRIFVGAHDDYLYCLAPTGDLRWIFEARADVDASATLAPDGTLLVGADDGHLYALRSSAP